ncbi:MAG: hypothetical protein QW818_02355 [Candidatus Aenigmatarchaeota archaeon]|nr:hypothetical protein [Candidatus Aenigmarchaeota archaeon]
MSLFDFCREYVKELYHDSIRTAGKFIVPIALAGTLGFLTACGPSITPTPVPTPTPHPIITKLKCYQDGEPTKISWNYQNPVRCFIDDEKVLIFEAPELAPIGETVNIRTFVSSKVYPGNRVQINYSKQRCIDVPGVGLGRCSDTENTEMLTLAEIPTDKEVILKFKPSESGSYNFFIPGVTFLEPEIRWPRADTSRRRYSENRGVIANICFGRPSEIVLKSDTKEVTPYTSILISGYANPPVFKVGIVVTKEGNFVKYFEIRKEVQGGEYIQQFRDFSINWLPETPGTYKITATSQHSCIRDGYLPSTSEMTITVKK